MRILLLCHAFNALTQRLHCELRSKGHEVSVEFDINDAVTGEAVDLFQPDVLIAPFLKRAIPASVFEALPCLVVHPGPPGDRGPAALDWAILEGKKTWGVTVLQAVAELDAGPVWASRSFELRQASKSSLYRHEVTEAAVSAVFEALDKYVAGESPGPVEREASLWRSAPRQADRALDWARDRSETILQKIRSADGMPGLLSELFGTDTYLYDARPCKTSFRPEAEPGTVIGRSGTALAVRTVDGAVWIGHVRRKADKAIKLPATAVFAAETDELQDVPGAYREIAFEEIAGVGYLHFDFYNGAMGTDACRRMLAAFEAAAQSSAQILVLTGGVDHWSNGLNLNLIEAADSPAEESWNNIQAIDDLAEAIIRTTGKWVISAMGGNAGAGGVFLARAADEVWIRSATVLNPHYKDMGNLYGSEYWTYLLPKHAGPENADRIARARWPMGAAEALELGLANRVFEADQASFADEVREAASGLADQDLTARLIAKAVQRERDERLKPLADYREAELARMRRNFFGFDPSYHVARYNFVRKVAKSRTPLTLATHRSGRSAVRQRTGVVS
ncbi:hydrogenase maturation protein [Labrenzia sp. VG12]|uniref:hydrogenase maturation protein n=1 Tax=Labrenzia sp. VG12 TaxID=2021862 RepID=UPI000B8C22D3|nr:enoyl-CoA hydratase-related protein [Labrenzia sp. VG12]ASP35302.1 hydrogenase maturation protein [Labrenzia sp. VG12]